jgi:hypothetical protein
LSKKHATLGEKKDPKCPGFVYVTNTTFDPGEAMLNRAARVAVLISLVLFFASSSATADDTAKKYAPMTPIVHANLTVVPLSLAEGQEVPSGEYLTFDEASKKGLVKVTELDGNTSNAQVSAVHVTSKADKPIYAMAGEVILGGKQDRIISKNTVIPAGEKKMKVGVFCVEQGRWNGREAEFEASGKVGHSKLRQKAVFDNKQGEVWKEVSEQNKKSRAQNSTQTYKASLKKTEKEARRYVEAILPELEKRSGVVGIAVAIDGEMIALDAFANPNLFSKVRGRLLESYALEAATSEDKKSGANVDASDAEAFLAEARAAKETERKDKSGEADNTYFDAAEVEGTSTKSKDGAEIQKFYRKK